MSENSTHFHLPKKAAVAARAFQLRPDNPIIQAALMSELSVDTMPYVVAEMVSRHGPAVAVTLLSLTVLAKGCMDTPDTPEQQEGKKAAAYATAALNACQQAVDQAKGQTFNYRPQVQFFPEDKADWAERQFVGACKDEVLRLALQTHWPANDNEARKIVYDVLDHHTRGKALNDSWDEQEWSTDMGTNGKGTQNAEILKNAILNNSPYFTESPGQSFHRDRNESKTLANVAKDRQTRGHHKAGRGNVYQYRKA